MKFLVLTAAVGSLMGCGSNYEYPTTPPKPYEPREARMLGAGPDEYGDWLAVHAQGKGVPLQLATEDAHGRTLPGCLESIEAHVAVWRGGEARGTLTSSYRTVELSTDGPVTVFGDWVAVQFKEGLCLRTWQAGPGRAPDDQWWVWQDGREPDNMALGGGSQQCPQGCDWQATIWP